MQEERYNGWVAGRVVKGLQGVLSCEWQTAAISHTLAIPVWQEKWSRQN